MRAELSGAGVPDDVLAAVDPLVGDAHLHGPCLAVVAHPGGVLHVEHGPHVPRRDLGRWAALPSMVPLLEWRQSSPPHVAVLADRRGADLFAFRRSGPDLRREAGGDDDPLTKSAPGGWSQRRYQQRAENTWEQNAGDVAKELARLVEQVGPRVVVAAGDVRALQLLREALPKEVTDILEVVEGERSPGSVDAVAENLARLVASAVAADTEAILEKFREELGQGDRAADGPARTLEALSAGQVEVLLVHDDPDDDRRAWFGPGPTQVAGTADMLAALGVPAPVEARLVDVAVRAALATGAGVRVIPPGGGPGQDMGAVLRWSP